MITKIWEHTNRNGRDAGGFRGMEGGKFPRKVLDNVGRGRIFVDYIGGGSGRRRGS